MSNNIGENFDYVIKKITHVVFNSLLPRDWVEWGTYGKSGNEPLRWVLLKDMTDEHIQAVLDTQHQICWFYRREFKSELRFRKKNPAFSLKETE